MNRRRFLASAGAAATPVLSAAPAGPSKLLADRFVTVYRSPDPRHLYAYSPGIARLDSGRLIATMDIGARHADLPGGFQSGSLMEVGRVFSSDNRGRTWTQRAKPAMMHARPFAAGESVYVLGHAGDLKVIRSQDQGDTWSEPAALTSGQTWHQAPSNVHYHDGRVYLVMERNTDTSVPWGVAVLAPVLMSAKVGDDLTRRESWVFSNELTFREAIAEAGPPHLLGVPFFNLGPTAPGAKPSSRPMNPIGWLETNVVQFTDRNHVWYDPAARTFHLFARAHTGRTNLACVFKAVESEDRSRITVSLERAPSGETLLYTPFPGGEMKFHLLYDPPSSLFWLVSTQPTDSMTRPERLPPDRVGLPDNERQRLVLHFSKNCIDWCFAGIVTKGATQGQARNYASMAIDGDDLLILARSGDEHALSAHDGNLITFHVVRKFRDLVY